MKPGETMKSLDSIESVNFIGDLRKVVATSLLALARKEISATDVEAMAKAMGAISESLNVEIKMHRLDMDLRKSGTKISDATDLGKLLLG